MTNRNSPRSLRTSRESILEIREAVIKFKDRDGLSWPVIAVRIGVSKTMAQQYYRDAKRFDNASGPVTANELRAQKRREAYS
ncbi:MAG TPA: hypothetical protein VNH83_28320 [Bryobacteraceae bacterium]|nr:hypothetical protein [Bryobacteraceae bacterium]